MNECNADGCSKDAVKCLHGRAIATSGDDGEMINANLMLQDDEYIQMLLSEGEGQRIMTFACPEHEDILATQYAAWEDDPFTRPLGVWTRSDTDTMDTSSQ